MTEIKKYGTKPLGSRIINNLRDLINPKPIVYIPCNIRFKDDWKH